MRPYILNLSSSCSSCPPPPPPPPPRRRPSDAKTGIVFLEGALFWERWNPHQTLRIRSFVPVTLYNYRYLRS